MEMMEPQATMASSAAAAASATGPGAPKGGLLKLKKSMLKRMLDDDDDVSSSNDEEVPKREAAPSKIEKTEADPVEATKPRLQRRGSSEKKKEDSKPKKQQKEAREHKSRKAEKKPAKSTSKPETAPVKVRSERLQLREALKESTDAAAAVVEEEAKPVAPRKRSRSGDLDPVDAPKVEETSKPKRPRMTRQESLEELQEEKRKREEKKELAAKTRRDRLQRRGSRTSDDGEVAAAVVEAPATEEITKPAPEAKGKRSRKEEDDPPAKVEAVEANVVVEEAKMAVVKTKNVVTETKTVVVETKKTVAEESKAVKARRVRAISSDDSDDDHDDASEPPSRRARDEKRSVDAEKPKAVDDEGDGQRQRKRIKRPLSATSNGASKKSPSLASLLDRERSGGSEKPVDRVVSRVKDEEKRRVKPGKADERPLKRREHKLKSLNDFLSKEKEGRDLKPKLKKRERVRDDASASLDDYLKAKEEAPRKVKDKKAALDDYSKTKEDVPRKVKEKKPMRVEEVESGRDARQNSGGEEESASRPRRLSEEGRVAIHNLLSQDEEENGNAAEDPVDASKTVDADTAEQPEPQTNGDTVEESASQPAKDSAPAGSVTSKTTEDEPKTNDEEEGAVSDQENAVEPAKGPAELDVSKAEKPAPPGDPMSFVIPKKRNVSTTNNREQSQPSANGIPARRHAAPAPQASPVSSVESTPVAAPVHRQRRSKNAVPPRLAPITPREKEFLRLTKKSNSLFKAASLMTVQKASRGAKIQPRLVSPFGCTTDRYGVLLQPPNMLFSEATKRMECPTRTHIKSANHPPAFFGVAMDAPPLATTSETHDAEDEKKKAIPCYETLEFERKEDRDWYQQRMYGTPFVPQLLRERVTLVMHNARYERKATGMHFNALRDKELYCESLAQRYTMNRSVPRCDILARNWQQLANGRTSFVFLHYMNREDAEQARRVFKDDEGQPLTFKNETRRMANGQGAGTPAPGRSPPPPMSSPPQPPRRRSPSPRQSRYGDRSSWPPRDHNVDYRDREDRGRRPYDGGPPRSPPARPRGRSRSRSWSARRGSHHDFATQSRELERGPSSQEHERGRVEEDDGTKVLEKSQDSSQATTVTHDSSMDGEEGYISSQKEEERRGDHDQSHNQPSQNGRSRSRSRSRAPPGEMHDHHREPLPPRSRSPPRAQRDYDDRSFHPRDRRGSREYYGRGMDINGRRGSFGSGRSPGPSSQEWSEREHHGRERDRHGAPGMNAGSRYGEPQPSHDHARHHDQHAYRDHHDNRDYRQSQVPDDRRARHGSDDYRRPHDHRDHRDQRDRGGHY